MAKSHVPTRAETLGVGRGAAASIACALQPCVWETPALFPGPVGIRTGPLGLSGNGLGWGAVWAFGHVLTGSPIYSELSTLLNMKDFYQS